MKQLIFIVLLVLNINSYAQDDKTVTLVVSGKGKTQDEAKQNAFRSAIEQAFGTFISSKTEILNDTLVKDEIVSVANGNIQKFDIISEVQIPNGDYATSLKATISLRKLASFVESKGVEVEFNGRIFEYNINLQKLNENSEVKAIQEILFTTRSILRKSLYGKLIPKDPYLKSGDIYILPWELEIHANENINSAIKYFSDNLNKLSLSSNELADYLKLNKPIYEIVIVSPNSPIDGKFDYKSNPQGKTYCPIPEPNYDPSNCTFQSIFLRNKQSYDLLFGFISLAYNEVFNFKIITDNNLVLNIDEIDKFDCKNGNQRYFANGIMPIGSPMNDRLYINAKRETIPVIFPDLPKYFPKYFNNRSNSSIYRKVPFFVISMHQYQKDGLIYQLHAKSNIILRDLGKISKIAIDYSNSLIN
jgi:hypothetical protein